MDPAILGIMIPILAIVGGIAVAIIRMWITHRERMAMIEAGLHPDHPELDEGDDDAEPARLPERTSDRR